MLGTHSLGVFAATVFVVNATPGVDMLFTLTQHAAHGVAARHRRCARHRRRLRRAHAARRVRAGGAAGGVGRRRSRSCKWAGAAYLAVAGDRHAARRRVGERARRDAGGGRMATAPASARRARSGRHLPPGPAHQRRSIRRSRSSSSPCCRSSSTPTRADKTLAFLFLGAWFVVQGVALPDRSSSSLVAPLRRWQPRGVAAAFLRAGGAALFAGSAARLRSPAELRRAMKVLVIGASRGIGLEFVRQYRADGADGHRHRPRRRRPGAPARARRHRAPARRRRRRQRLGPGLADRGRGLRRRDRQRRRRRRARRRPRHAERSRLRPRHAHQRARADARAAADRRGAGAGRRASPCCRRAWARSAAARRPAARSTAPRRRR